MSRIRNLTMRKLIHRMLGLRRQNPWPHAGPEAVLEQPFLMVLTPPNSGSSAMANFLGQSSNITGLGWPEFGAGRVYEGQWLVPGLADSDRWWPEKYVHWESVAGTWHRRLDELRRRRPFDYVLEKSPPNIVRYKGLARMLPQARFIINNRDPFANIASQIKRYGHTLYKGVPQDQVVAHLAELWLYRSRHLREAHLTVGFPLLSYESFCADPLEVVRLFGLEGEIDLRGDYAVQVKDYKSSVISNMNARQINRLSATDTDIISNILARDPALVDFFGYKTHV